MGFLFGNKQRDELLVQTQETLGVVQANNHRLTAMLDVAQKNNEILASSLSGMLAPQSKPEEECVSPELVAYALNLCMVSVSQIIQYNDVRVMEQEYEAILNNLNLQNFPKDEALLTAIKQILDSITFFKVQDGERRLLEEEYRHKVKSAIWKALPGIGIIPSKDVVGTVLSVVAQVGIGYMNYRNDRAETDLEHKRKLWELERAAIEQFNGLRRELFETAWRLSDKYHFDDKYRLTERTISQYNAILIDLDPLRRYERLLYLSNQGKFSAYPPIQYYLGHAANEVYLENPQQEEHYRDLAKQHLSSYIHHFGNGNELLREDLLLAQACLEYYDLLTLEERRNSTWLIAKAQEKSGNALDVQQMCALAHFQAGDYANTVPLLKMLVNEEYNSEINAQLLSIVYAIQKDPMKDETDPEMVLLRERNPGVTLMRMPDSVWSLEHCMGEFIESKRRKVKREYSAALSRFVNEYQVGFTSIWLQYNADYNQYVAFFLKMGNDLQQLCKYPTYIFVGKIKPHIKDIANHLKDAQNYTAEIAVKQFSAVVKEAVTDSAERINECIASATLPDLIRIENEIWEYRLLKGHVSQNADTFLVSAEQERLESAFLGKDYAKLKLLHEKINACMKVLKEKTFAASNMYSDGGEKHLRFAVRGDGEYDRYRIKYKEKIDSWRLGDGARSLASIVAIVNSRRLSDLDMLLTTAGIVYLKRHELIGSVKYSEVRHSEKNGQKIIMIGDNIEHDARDLNIDKFIELCGRLNTAVSDNSTNLLPEEIDKIFFPLPTSGVIYL
jgi:hypothetical protein